jgi:hypothetical protein
MGSISPHDMMQYLNFPPSTASQPSDPSQSQNQPEPVHQSEHSELKEDDNALRLVLSQPVTASEFMLTSSPIPPKIEGLEESLAELAVKCRLPCMSSFPLV